MNYVLRDKKIVRIDDAMEWAREFSATERQIARTDVGGRFVSTIFLGVDYSFDGPVPVLFETMVFNSDVRSRRIDHMKTWGIMGINAPPWPESDDPWDCWRVRHSGSYEQAEEGHRRTVELVTQNPEGPA